MKLPGLPQCRQIPASTLLFLSILTFALGVEGGEFYVATTGDDANVGTSPEAAFATVSRARDAVRAAKSTQNADAPELWTIHIAAGVYPLTAPLRFGPEDSGEPDAPVVYRGSEEGQTLISGGIEIPGWTTRFGW